MITIRQVEALIWSVRLGTLSRAAHRLNTAQPTISKRLQELEAACGFQIFEKRGRKLHLSEKGKGLHGLAEKILELVLQVEDLQKGRSLVERRIAIGVTEFAAHTWVANMVEKIRTEHPHIIPLISIEHCVLLRQKLVRGELDLIVCPSFAHGAGVSSLWAQGVKFALVGSPRFFSPSRRYLGPELSAHAFLTHDPVSAIVALETWMADVGFRPEQTVQVDSLVAQIEMARAGMGLTIVPARSVSPLISSGQLTEIKSKKSIPDVVYRIYARRNEWSSSLEGVVEIIRNICNFDKNCQYITELYASDPALSLKSRPSTGRVRSSPAAAGLGGATRRPGRKASRPKPSGRIASQDAAASGVPGEPVIRLGR